jgi:oligosaccharide repeat unit polymerase
MLVAVRFGAGLLSPVAVYAAIWGLAALVVTRPARGYLPVDEETWALVFVAFGAFVCGCVAAAALRVPEHGAAHGLYDEARLDRAFRWGLLALAASVALDIIRLLPLLTQAGGVSGLLSGGGLSFREAQFEASADAATTGFGSGSLATAMLAYVFFAGYLTLVWGGYYAVRGRWLRALVPLLLVAAYSLLSLQRFPFVSGLLIFAFSFRYHRRLIQREAQASRRPMIALALVAVAVVFVPLQLRGQAVTGSERYDSVVDYFAGGLAGLNTSIVEDVPIPDPNPGHGVWSLYGAASIAKRFGAPLTLPPAILPSRGISLTRSTPNNVGTYLIYPYYDFGLAGLVAFACALGALATWLDRAVLLGRRVVLVPAGTIALTTIAMSFFGLSLLRDARWLYLVAVGCAVTRHLAPGAARPQDGAAPVGRAPRALARRLMEAQEATVCAVTVTHGDRAHLAEQAVAGALAAGAGSVVVVANGATDAARRRLEACAERAAGAVTCRVLSRNEGAAAGFAAGIEAALAGTQAQLLWLLDDDNVPEPEALRALLVAGEQLADGGAERVALLAYRPDRAYQRDIVMGVAPKHAYPRRSSFLSFHPYGYLARAVARRRARRGTPPGEPVQVPYGPFGGLLLPRAVAERMGLPDRALVLYEDDTDFTWRLSALGVPLFLVPASRVQDVDEPWYAGAARDPFTRLLRTGAPDRVYYATRNRVHFETRHWVGRPRVRRANEAAFMAVLRVVAALRGDHGRYALIRRAVEDGRRGRLGPFADDGQGGA